MSSCDVVALAHGLGTAAKWRSASPSSTLHLLPLPHAHQQRRKLPTKCPPLTSIDGVVVACLTLLQAMAWGLRTSGRIGSAVFDSWADTIACLFGLAFSDKLFWESGYGENLAVKRIWVLLGLRVEEDKGTHMVRDLERDELLLLQRLNQLCVYVDFGWFLKIDFYRSWMKKISVWQSATSFSGQKL